MSNLVARLDRFSDHKILCIGDLMLDRYVYGQVDRISPEAPIPVLHVHKEVATLGGAGNVVRNIAALGGHVTALGVVGKDHAGDTIERELKAIPSVTPLLLNDPSRPSTQKIRYVAATQQLLRADCEQADPLAQSMEHALLAKLSEAIGTAEAVILSDYLKGVLTPSVIKETIRLAASLGKPVIVDPKGRDFSKYAGATLLTPNRKELSDATGAKISTVEDAETAARRLIDDFGISSILVKLGGDGVCLVTKDQPALHFYTKAREVFDVSGAGDTVIASLVLALVSGFTLPEAAEIANIGGSIVVGKVGTATITCDEIAHELLYGKAHLAENKIVGFTTIRDLAERWRRQGLKVGFTNGCFDLLHPGHISLLRQARAACDKLVVGLNSDASVKRLKGETRPVQNEDARSAVLASLADVDHVVIFEEDTPLNLINTVRPDVLVKGADYTVDTVVGAKEVESWGGKVVLAQLMEGQSTTNTIAKMAR